MTAGIPKTLAQTIYRRDNYACALCGNPIQLCIHHIIPRGSDGKNHEHNLIVLCHLCHLDAHNAKDHVVQEETDYAIVVALRADSYSRRCVVWPSVVPARVGWPGGRDRLPYVVPRSKAKRYILCILPCILARFQRETSGKLSRFRMVLA